MQDARECRRATLHKCGGMTQLGSREGAKLVISTQLRPSGPNSQYLTTVVFDVARRVPHDEHGLCDRCSPDLLSRTIAELAERSLRNYRERCRFSRLQLRPPLLTAPASAAPAAREPRSHPSDGGTGPADPSSPDAGGHAERACDQQRDFWSRMPKNRKIAAGISAVPCSLHLFRTVALHATDGQETGLACGSAPCVLHNQPLYIGGYALSGALAVGLTLTILWPTGKGSATTTASAVEVK